MSELYKFDRKTFNPTCDYRHSAILKYLRQHGASRLNCYNHRYTHKPQVYQSSTFRALQLKPTSERKIYLDLGCGHSPDILVARDLGYEAWGVDLYRPNEQLLPQFIQADFVDGLPFESGSVDCASCHAAIGLVKPDERLAFYTELARVMKQGSELALSYASLTNGYGFNSSEESAKLREAGFKRLVGRCSALVFANGLAVEGPRRPYTNCTPKDFKKGDKVRQSQYGFDHLKRELPNATVVGFSTDSRCIRIKLDSQKYANSYYAGFWEPVGSAPVD